MYFFFFFLNTTKPEYRICIVKENFYILYYCATNTHLLSHIQTRTHGIIDIKYQRHLRNIFLQSKDFSTRKQKEKQNKKNFK